MTRRRHRLPSEPVTLEIESLRDDGRGVAHADGRPVLVAGALAGERVRARYIRRSRGGYEAVAEEIVRGATERVIPGCAHFDVCGGCALQHMEPDAQLALKRSRLLKLLGDEGLAPEAVLPPIRAQEWGYRRKARLGVRWLESKRLALVGFRERGSSRVAILSRCEILDSRVGRRINLLRELIASMDARARIPQVEISLGDRTGTLIFRTLDPLGPADRKRLRSFAEVHDLQVCLQPGGPEPVEPLWPEVPRALSYRLPELALRFEFGPLDFTQVHAHVNRLLVSQAIKLLAPMPSDRVLDLFCGLGNFTLALARAGGRVSGLEGSHQLVARARDNAIANAVDNVDFHAVDLFDTDTARPWLEGGVDKILLDPPRSGALAIVENLDPRVTKRVVYVSCNPATLARDAKVLVDRHRMRLQLTGIVDMFPHTTHMETISLFEA